MALVIDTIFLLTHTFPPSIDDREKIVHFIAKVIEVEKVIIPSVVVAEYIKVAGRRIGKAAAIAKLNTWLGSGAIFIPLTKEIAMKAGELLLRYPNVPIADAIIAAIAISLHARIVSKDPHFKILGVKNIWYK